MIGIIGYGMVGKAVDNGFSKTKKIISDPSYNSIKISDVCKENPEAIFVCVPTPTDDSNYQVIKDVLTEIRDNEFSGLIVVKSTILPHHIEQFDVLYNPEFLSRATSFNDFINPPMVIIGGDSGEKLLEIYKKYSIVDMSKTFLVDLKTASLAKYIMNTFYATKITFMNEMFDVATDLGANYSMLINILSQHPWMGTHHFQVPGPDGKRGFGGPCLPKDTEAMVKEFKLRLLQTVLEINKKYRGNE
jgi:nucleotide sugar dehydrogenase